jgi:hypothetical protein
MTGLVYNMVLSNRDQLVKSIADEEKYATEVQTNLDKIRLRVVGMKLNLQELDDYLGAKTL